MASNTGASKIVTTDPPRFCLWCLLGCCGPQVHGVKRTELAKPVEPAKDEPTATPRVKGLFDHTTEEESENGR